MTEKEKKIEDKKNKESKIMNENEIEDLEKDIENYMKFKVARNQKTSLIDPLDILKKEPKLIPIEKQIKKYHDKSNDGNNSIKNIKLKKYNSGLEINYFLDKNNQMEIVSINKESIETKILQNLETSLDSNLD